MGFWFKSTLATGRHRPLIYPVAKWVPGIWTFEPIIVAGGVMLQRSEDGPEMFNN